MMEEHFCPNRRESDLKIQELHDAVMRLTLVMENHVKEEEKIRPALEELITLYKGSKIVIPALAAFAISAVAVIAWAKEHIKW